MRRQRLRSPKDLTGFTHLFNAMRPLGARDPGPIAAALECSDAWFGMIVDGVHVDPAMLRLALRGSAHPMLVTDAMPPVGGSRRTFSLFGRDIEARGEACVAEDGTLAGSALDMASAVRNCVRLLGVPLTSALRLRLARAGSLPGHRRSSWPDCSGLSGQTWSRSSRGILTSWEPALQASGKSSKETRAPPEAMVPERLLSRYHFVICAPLTAPSHTVQLHLATHSLGGSVPLRTLSAALSLAAAVLLASFAYALSYAPNKNTAADIVSGAESAGFSPGSPVMIRIFKRESQLEVWMLKDARFELFAVHPICYWSGRLGPKEREGDRQAPEGFYSVGIQQLHLIGRHPRSLNIGFPNAFDRASNRTGSYILVHGGCTSVGCFAMTDPVMEQIYALSEKALHGGQDKIQVQIFPVPHDGSEPGRRGGQ